MLHTSPHLVSSHLAALLLVVPSGLLAGRQAATPPPIDSYPEIAAHPAQHLGRSLRLRVQFHSVLTEWNPFLTRFGADGYVGVQAWADEQMPWIQEEYDAPGVRLFARRSSACADLLIKGRPHERFEVVCEARELFAGTLWIEVTEAKRADEQIPEGSVLHVIRALELQGRKAWNMAEDELDRALSAPLPGHAQVAVEQVRASGRRAAKRRR